MTEAHGWQFILSILRRYRRSSELLNIVKSRMLADLYVRREYTGDLRIRVKLDNGDRYIITIKEESAPRSAHP